MPISDVDISRIIIESYAEKLKNNLRLDVAIAGAGPSGLVAAHDLARKGFKVAIFESKLSPGGGMWGGGMLFNVGVYQPEAAAILKDFGIKYRATKKYLVADSVLSAAALTVKAIEAGATLFNGVSVEDLMVRDGSVTGVVINWTSVAIARLHVDPMSVEAKTTVDATGHDACLAHFAIKKGLKLDTPSGVLVGEGFMWAERGEKQVVEQTGEFCPGLYSSGMAANAIKGGYRMGPIFGGMLLSGRKVASLIAEKLGGRPKRQGIG